MHIIVHLLPSLFLSHLRHEQKQTSRCIYCWTLYIMNASTTVNPKTLLNLLKQKESLTPTPNPDPQPQLIALTPKANTDPQLQP